MLSVTVTVTTFGAFLGVRVRPRAQRTRRRRGEHRVRRAVAPVDVTFHGEPSGSANEPRLNALGTFDGDLVARRGDHRPGPRV